MLFRSLHAWVGSNLENLPTSGGGAPIPGHFPYKPDASGTQNHTITIPFAALGITDATRRMT